MSKREMIEDSIKELDETISSMELDLDKTTGADAIAFVVSSLEEASMMRDEMIVQWEDETGETWID